ncbi:hypothetical protein BD560DRAFT_475844 [Blakeslea trispora]|nr:hypothetical protein BD560DRAFT_475844 [Blakeslea trispora]
MSQKRNSSSFLEMSTSDLSSTEQAYIQNPSESSEYDLSSSSDECTVPIRTRQRFKPNEISILEQQYQICSKPSSETKIKLAQKLNTELCRIQVWFQNRRAKAKKSTKPDAYNVQQDDNDEDNTSEGVLSPSANEKQSSSDDSSRASSQQQQQKQLYQSQHGYFDSQTPNYPFLNESSSSGPSTTQNKRYKSSHENISIGLTQQHLHENMQMPYIPYHLTLHTISPSQTRSLAHEEHPATHPYTQLSSNEDHVYQPSEAFKTKVNDSMNCPFY